MVEIYDFAGRLHEVEMAPGEIVYYEVTIREGQQQYSDIKFDV